MFHTSVRRPLHTLTPVQHGDVPVQHQVITMMHSKLNHSKAVHAPPVLVYERNVIVLGIQRKIALIYYFHINYNNYIVWLTIGINHEEWPR